MNKILWIIMAFLSGAFLPIQAGLNSKLGKAGASPVYASLISFIIGGAALALYVVLTRETFSWSGLKAAPVYSWVGGILGAFYVTAIILCFPKLGPGLTFGLVVTGQMFISLLLEHFNILVDKPHPLNYIRLIGVLLVVVGVIIIRKF